METLSPKVKDVKIVGDIAVKPKGPLSSSSNAPCHPYLRTLVPLTIFDLANYDCHIPILYAFQAPMPDNRIMENALAQTLFYYPHLAGRFSTDDAGWPCILLDDYGVRFIETHVPTTLTENLPFDPSSDLSNLLPPVVGARHLFQVQLNRFTCGGVAIGTTSHHRVADGRAMGAFFTTWSTIARGHDAVTPSPFHDRVSVSASRSRPHVDFPHQEIEFIKKSSPLLRKPLSGSEVAASLEGIINLGVHFSKDFIAKLKAEATCGDVFRRCSTFQCILAHVWKKITAARGLSSSEYTTIRTAVDGRCRMMNPPVPNSYFGNLVLWAFPRVKAGKLLRMSYAEVAGIIREAVAKVDEAYFRSFIDFAELKLKGVNAEDNDFVCTMPAAGDVLCPDMEFNSWLGLELNDVNFGGGMPCCFFPPMLPVEGLAILIRSCGETEGANLFVALKKEQAQLFREIAYSIY